MCNSAFWHSRKRALTLDNLETFFRDFILPKEVLDILLVEDVYLQNPNSQPCLSLLEIMALYGVSNNVSENDDYLDNIARRSALIKLMSEQDQNKRLALFKKHCSAYLGWKLKVFNKRTRRKYRTLIDYILTTFNLVMAPLLKEPCSPQSQHDYVEPYIILIGNIKTLIEITELLEALIKGEVDNPENFLEGLVYMVDEFQVDRVAISEQKKALKNSVIEDIKKNTGMSAQPMLSHR